MKKLTFLLSAFALLGLASCNELAEINPNYDATTNEVKTNFIFNIATQAQTKATATEVQDGTNFRGMDNMNLFVTTQHPGSADFIPNYKFELPALSTSDISSTQSSKIYRLSIPLGVNNMVFYGKAAGNTDPKQYGKTGWNVGTNKAGTHFDIEKILDATKKTDFENRGKLLAAILNDVISAEGWAALATTTDLPSKPLRDAYKDITTITGNELRLGSGPAIVRMLNDLYIVVNGLATATTTPANIKTIAQAIQDKITLYFNASPSFTFKDVNTLSGVGAIGADATLSGIAGGLVENDLRLFPRNMNVPSGAAQLEFKDGKFQYVTKPTTMGSVGAAITDVANFAYPSELCYWVCSPIRVTSNDIEDADYPVTVTTWSADDSWTRKWGDSNKNGTVVSTTTAVALQNNINYANAALKTTVKYGAATLKDNRKAILDAMATAEGTTNTETDKEIPVTGSIFNIEGILVGGQPDRVEWNWAPANGSTFNNVVYDQWVSANGVDLPIPATGSTTPIYTMLLDNLVLGAETSGQNKVLVAIELENNTGADFWGRDNLIRDHGTFYLVGELDLTTARNLQDVQNNYPVNTDENGYRYPPLKAQQLAANPQAPASEANDYDNHQVIRIFMQDFVTNVEFTIGENSLKHAYATVPDLRAVEMTFGLSVDLDWTSGLSFSIAL